MQGKVPLYQHVHSVAGQKPWKSEKQSGFQFLDTKIILPGCFLLSLQINATYNINGEKSRKVFLYLVLDGKPVILIIQSR